MPDTGAQTPERFTDVLLEGGPAEFAHRQHHTGNDPTKMAVRHLGGYEHYEATGETKPAEGEQLPVFHWAYHTEIAE